MGTTVGNDAIPLSFGELVAVQKPREAARRPGIIGGEGGDDGRGGASRGTEERCGVSRCSRGYGADWAGPACVVAWQWANFPLLVQFGRRGAILFKGHVRRLGAIL